MTDWKQEEAFQKMSPEKQQMILLLNDTLNGKKLTEALPVLVQWKKEMQKKKISFTDQENALLTEIFSSQLTPAQRQQYEYLKHFIK